MLLILACNDLVEYIAFVTIIDLRKVLAILLYLVTIKNQSTKMVSPNVLKSLENILKNPKLSIPTFLMSLMKNVKDYFHPLYLFLMDLNYKIYIEFTLILTMTYFNLKHVLNVILTLKFLHKRI